MADTKILRNIASTIRSANTVGFPDFRSNAAKSIESAADEIDRLREVLQKIADEDDTFNYGHQLPEIARKALQS